LWRPFWKAINEAYQAVQLVGDLGQPHGHMREVFFGLLPKFEKTLDQSGLGFLHVRLTSLDFGHNNCSVLQGPDGLIVVHAFSVMKNSSVLVLD
jgi:hypothetical protein